MAEGPVLVDVGRLTAWLDDQDLESGPIDVEPFASGRSNSMSVIRRGSAEWVLRRPSRVAIEKANEGMRREFRFLRALWDTDVPVPQAVALCDDHEVLGCTFYLMTRVAGVHPFPAPEAFADDAGRRAVAHAMVDGLALLHDADWEGAGLADLGHPERFHERQVERWSGQLAGYSGREMAGADDVMAWLSAQPVPDFRPAIMHGDYHMLNVLVSAEPPARVTAILDWETATIGDPLLDLAGFCAIWVPATGEGWPTRAELIERYAEARRLGELGDLRYYEVLHNFRLGVLLEGIHQRALKDESRSDQAEVGAMALDMMGRAVAAVDGAMR